PRAVPDKARDASPISYISEDDPPILSVYGTEDKLVPFAQGTAFDKEMLRVGAPSTFITVDGGGHGSGFGPDVVKAVHQFIRHHLLDEGSAPPVQTLKASKR
ncbi:MAG: prolyl oligopeptidase family serine peptidase, partial [Verrucomicrobiota bacterium]